MNKPVLKTSPNCAKCKQPTVWHSVHEVTSAGREETMNVFQCATCERLSAHPEMTGAA